MPKSDISQEDKIVFDNKGCLVKSSPELGNEVHHSCAVHGLTTQPNSDAATSSMVNSKANNATRNAPNGKA